MNEASPGAGRIGAISWLNALPLTESLARWRGGTVRWAPPSELARALRAGELDLALVPQVEIAAEPGFRVVRGLGIACRGAAESILLFAPEPEAPLARIAVDAASRSSVELLRVLLRLDGRPDAELFPAPPELAPESLGGSGADALLLIGDRALAARASPTPRIDLGAWWFERTGLPFVFALWAGPEGASAEVRRAVRGAAREGLPRRAEIARAFAREHPAVIGEEDAVRYLVRTIHHEIGAEEQESLSVFAELRREMGAPVPAGWRPLPFEEPR